MEFSGAKLVDCGEYIFCSAAHPLTLNALEAFLLEALTNHGVTEHSSVLTLCQLVYFKSVFNRRNTLRFTNSRIHITGCLTNFQTSLELCDFRS